MTDQGGDGNRLLRMPSGTLSVGASEGQGVDDSLGEGGREAAPQAKLVYIHSLTIHDIKIAISYRPSSAKEAIEVSQSMCGPQVVVL